MCQRSSSVVTVLNFLEPGVGDLLEVEGLDQAPVVVALDMAEDRGFEALQLGEEAPGYAPNVKLAVGGNPDRATGIFDLADELGSVHSITPEKNPSSLFGR